MLVVFTAGANAPHPPAPKKPPVVKAAPSAEPAAPLPRAGTIIPASTQDALARLRQLYKGLEYDEVIPLADALLAREDLTLDERLDVYRLQGSARAIVEDPVDAEKPFRLLLRARVDYELPTDTPPKILAVFRKVQSEEKALNGQLREVERARIIANLRLVGEVPAQSRGGKAIVFSFRLKDPTGSVETLRVPFRRAGQTAFSSLALDRSEDGSWVGQIPGEFTSDEKGFRLEYYVESADTAGPLLTLGSGKEPRTVDVTAGLFTTERRKPLPRGAFIASAVVTGVLGLGTGTLAVLFNRQQASYAALVRSNQPIAGAELMRQGATGDAFATATNVALISTGVALVATVIIATQTRFDEEH